MGLEKVLNLRRTVAFRLTLWYAAFFTGCILIAFTVFHFALLRGIHHVQLSAYSLHELLEVYRRFFGASLAGVALSSIFVGWFLARRALSGVEDVRRTAQSIAKGAFDSRVPVKGTGDEVDQLAVTFNGMLGQIETVLCSMKEINDNIAHDLRSPIARMRGIAEMTLASRGSVEDYETVVGRVVEDCDGLLGIINTMLDISEAEAGLMRLGSEEIDMGDMIRDVLDLFGPLIEDKGLNVCFRPSGSLSFQGDTHKIQRVLSNLLDNAIKYTPRGGSITVSAYGSDQAVRVFVRDTGIGIPEPEIPHLFDRFFRGEKSRSDPGNGLGLSLARALVFAHRGTIAVASTPGEGSAFKITLPKVQP
jgi:signal transduction histidine kinase